VCRSPVSREISCRAAFGSISMVPPRFIHKSVHKPTVGSDLTTTAAAGPSYTYARSWPSCRAKTLDSD
jgi:hypothetical protein